MSPTKELSVGAMAPDFSLSDEQGSRIRLSDFRKKQAVVLIFYPGDLTPGCTLQLCSIRDDWKNFVTNQIAVFGINHANQVSHQKFSKKYSFPFPLLIDADKKVSAQYGAIQKLFSATVIRRSVVGIDKDGVIRFLKRGMPKDAEILKIMKSYS